MEMPYALLLIFLTLFHFIFSPSDLLHLYCHVYFLHVLYIKCHFITDFMSFFFCLTPLFQYLKFDMHKFFIC